jgi:3' terminal RNA ribose 2'-O-methyltransferase Hen1
VLATITTTLRPATDLGYLLMKHPDRVQEFTQTFGTAHVFYPEATEDRCTIALLLEVDPIKLAKVRAPGGRGQDAASLGQYVNDRPYAASSLFASALTNVFRTAMKGRCEARPELAAAPIPLTIRLPALPCRGGPEMAARLFEPLGWTVEATSVPLDPEFPDWGDSRYVTLTLDGRMRIADALNQLYVMLPVLDDSKHYWVSFDEVDKLIRAGEGWLATHPERDRITRRYLANRAGLVRSALGRLADDEPEDALEQIPVEEETVKTTLADRRIESVIAALKDENATDVIDLGCGSGRLAARLLKDKQFSRVTGVDVSYRAITMARRRFDPERLPRGQAERLEIFQGALTYADERFAGYDAAVLMEVIEHIDPPRLPAVAQVVFGDAHPRVVIVTTPNVEYNVRYEQLTGSRHPDHRFEWTRAEFQSWAEPVAAAYGYRVRYAGVGDEDPEVGCPTQLAVFSR